MTEIELSEIRATIEKIKHCEPLQGKYYELQRAVLPLLGLAYDMSANKIEREYDFYIEKQALSIARVINKKHSITEYKGEQVKAVADIKALKKKEPPRLSKAKIKELQAKGQIKE